MAKWFRCSVSKFMGSTLVGSIPVFGTTNLEPITNSEVTLRIQGVMPQTHIS